MERSQRVIQSRSLVPREHSAPHTFAHPSHGRLHARRKPIAGELSHARSSSTRLQAASSLGSTSSIDFEEEKLLARTLPQGDVLDGTAGAGAASTSGQAGQNGTAETATPRSSSLEGVHSAAHAPHKQNSEGSWKLRFPLPRWKQKRLVRQTDRLPPAPAPRAGKTRQQLPASPRPALTRSLSRTRSSSFKKAAGWGPLAWLQQRFGQAPRTDYVKIDFRAPSKQTVNPFQPSSWPKLDVDVGTFWGLLVLSLAYVHHSTTG